MHELAVPEVTLQVGLRWLDLLGILAFSLSGALLGVRKRFDLFGVLVLGCVTAVGGGAIRDTLTGAVERASGVAMSELKGEKKSNLAVQLHAGPYATRS